MCVRPRARARDPGRVERRPARPEKTIRFHEVEMANAKVVCTARRCDSEERAWSEPTNEPTEGGAGGQGVLVRAHDTRSHVASVSRRLLYLCALHTVLLRGLQSLVVATDNDAEKEG